jgi:hypothetical protein
MQHAHGFWEAVTIRGLLRKTDTRKAATSKAESHYRLASV